MIITIDEQQKQIGEQQKQIDSLKAMVTDLVEGKQKDLKRGHTLQGTNMWIEESNHHFAQRLVKLETKIYDLSEHTRFQLLEIKELKESWKGDMDAVISDISHSRKQEKELMERIEKLEAHLGEVDGNTPDWLKDMTIQQQIKQVDGDAEADVQDLRKDLTNRIVELEKINNKRANDPSRLTKLEKKTESGKEKVTSCE